MSEHPAAPTSTPMRNAIPSIMRAIVAPPGVRGSFAIFVYLLGFRCVRFSVPLFIPLNKFLSVVFVLKEISYHSAQHSTDRFSLVDCGNIYGHFLYLSSYRFRISSDASMILTTLGPRRVPAMIELNSVLSVTIPRSSNSLMSQICVRLNFPSFSRINSLFSCKVLTSFVRFYKQRQLTKLFSYDIMNVPPIKYQWRTSKNRDVQRAFSLCLFVNRPCLQT